MLPRWQGRRLLKLSSLACPHRRLFGVPQHIPIHITTHICMAAFLHASASSLGVYAWSCGLRRLYSLPPSGVPLQLRRHQCGLGEAPPLFLFGQTVNPPSFTLPLFWTTHIEQSFQPPSLGLMPPCVMQNSSHHSPPHRIPTPLSPNRFPSTTLLRHGQSAPLLRLPSFSYSHHHPHRPRRSCRLQPPFRSNPANTRHVWCRITHLLALSFFCEVAI